MNDTISTNALTATPGFFTNDEPDEDSAQYWNDITTLINTATNKKVSKKKLKELTTFLKYAQEEMLKIINEQACKKK